LADKLLPKLFHLELCTPQLIVDALHSVTVSFIRLHTDRSQIEKRSICSTILSQEESTMQDPLLIAMADLNEEEAMKLLKEKWTG